MRPVTCLITDRRRLPPGDFDALLASIAAAAAAGVDLVQLRERDLDGGALLRLARDAMACVAGTRTRVLVNDRLDVALAAGAHGVHLRGDSMPPARVRAIAPRGFLVGQSVHGVDDAVRAGRGGADLLIFGHVYPTASKPGLAAAGPAQLRRIVESTPVPVLAVGGITAGRFDDVAASGASGFAAIGLFADAGLEGVRATLTAARAAFGRH